MTAPRHAHAALALFLLTGAVAACDDGPPSIAPPSPIDGGHVDDAAQKGSLVVTPPTSLATTEGGASVSFALQLSHAPTGLVTVTVASSNDGEGRIDTGVYKFSPESWSTPQRVVVHGVDDAQQDGPQPFDVLFAVLQSKDRAFDGVRTPALHLVNLDDDTAGIRVTATPGLATTEAGGAARFSVALASAPASEVTLGVVSSNGNEGAPATTSLHFDASDWSVPKEVTVKGVDDLVDDGDQPFEIRLAVSGTRDPSYARVAAASVALTNVDDDTADLIVEGATSLGEAWCESGYAWVFVRLAARPEGDVRVPVRASDPSAFTVSPALLTFTPDTWDIKQPMFLACTNDRVANPDRLAAIVVGPTQATTGAYRSVAATRHAMAILDNDVARIRVTRLSAPYTTEAGGKVSIDLALDAQPVTPVTLTIRSTNPAEADVTPKTVVWTSAQYDEKRTLEVVGFPDNVADGDAPFTIDIRVDPTSDPTYRSVVAPQVALENLDASSNFLRFTELGPLLAREARLNADGSVVAAYEGTGTTTYGLPAGNVLGTLSHTATSIYELGALSDDGASVAFVESNHAFTQYHLVVAPRDLRSLETLHIPADGGALNAAPREVAISGDGRYVLFTSSATNVDPADASATAKAYLFDRTTQALTRISDGVAGATPNADASRTSLAADGAAVVFSSRATNLVAGATTPELRTYLWRRGAGLTVVAAQTGVASTPRRALSATGAWLSIVPWGAVVPDGPMRIELSTGASTRASFTTLFGLPPSWRENGFSYFDVSPNGSFMSTLLFANPAGRYAGVYDFAAGKMMKIPYDGVGAASNISSPSNDGRTVILSVTTANHGLIVARHD